MNSLDKIVAQPDWIFVVLTLAGILLSLSALFFGKKILNVFLKQELVVKNETYFYMFNNTALVILLGVYLYDFIGDNLTIYGMNELSCFIIIGAYLLVKYLISLFLANYFELQNLFEDMIKVKNLFRYGLNITLLIVSFYVFYTKVGFNNETIIISSLLGIYIVLLYLILIYRYVVMNNVGIYYILLYLCALEISPLLVIINNIKE